MAIGCAHRPVGSSRPIPPQRPHQHLTHALAQLRGRDDFGVGAVALDVHQQFAGIRVGDGEFEGAVGEEALALLRVPDLVGDPAGGVRGEVEDGGVRFAAGEDAVAGLLVGVEVGGGEFEGGLGGEFGLADAVEGEAAEALGGGLVGVEVPVVAVVGEALR